MTGGGRVQITDRDGRNSAATARVVNGRLLTSSASADGSPSDINIVEVGGEKIGDSVPVDIENVTVGTASSADLKELSVSDQSSHALLEGILCQLKIIARHLAEMTEEEFNEDDCEDEA